MTETKVNVRIQPGRATPMQEQKWREFWQKLITEVKGNIKSKAKQEDIKCRE